MAATFRLFVSVCGAAAAATTAGPDNLPSRAQLPTACDVAAVGGGWAGVYYAFRTIESQQGNQRVCLFEATERIGGRTYSRKFETPPMGPGKSPDGWTLDLGAYRFSPDMHLPGDVILKVLNLSTECYEPDCALASKDFPAPFQFNYTAPLRRIVDAEGMPSGYATALHRMVDIIKAKGGQVYMNARLLDFVPLAGNGSRLVFEGGRAVEVSSVLLNLPRQSLLSLPTLKARTPARIVKMEECVKFDQPEDMFPGGHGMDGQALTKAYAFYEEAWWVTRLNQTEGQFPRNAFSPVNTSQGIPVGIRFSDGPLRCEDKAERRGCRGFLEVYYAETPQADFYTSLRPDEWHPAGVVKAGQDPEGRLPRLHAALMEATRELFKNTSATVPTAPPGMLVVGVWDKLGQGYSAPTKVYYSVSDSIPGGPDPLEKACGVPGLSEAEYRQSLLMPTGSAKLLVANNDWVALQSEKFFGDWAEESLLQAERGLRAVGKAAPEWLESSYYEAKVVAPMLPAYDAEARMSVASSFTLQAAGEVVRDVLV